ncbi:MAG: hypothetical protein JW779_06230 [Candidatus Thorarchaeota archaeon]|nr:hypothetical protein [Candidatus Thorarchaeota archaeon]
MGLILLGALSLLVAYYWYRQSVSVNEFIIPLVNRLGEPDTSGKKQYTNCESHRWIMKNVVYGDYLKASEGFRNFMMNRTMTGTLILGVALGLIPVILVYILFQSYQLIGTSLVLLILSVFVIRGPGELEVSNQLFEWQVEQNCETLTIGDLAYARISQRSIQKWIKKLMIIGIISLCLAPWGEEIFPVLAYTFTLFIGFAYTYLFVPISTVSMPVALMVFFVLGPVILIGGAYTLKHLFLKTRKKEEGLKL